MSLSGLYSKYSHLFSNITDNTPSRVSALYATVSVTSELNVPSFTQNFHLCEAFVFYDYFVTLPEEVKQIWQGNLNASKVLFILNRYTYLIFQFFSTINAFWRADDAVLHFTQIIFETDHFVFYVYRGKHKRNRCKPDISNIYLKMQWSSASSFRPYLNFSDYLHNLWVPPFARITLGSI